MTGLSKKIQYFGKDVTLACDGKCNKAWGINQRPRVYNTCEEEAPDDFEFLADSELGEAPDGRALGTYEGGHGKPNAKSGEDMNKWCARECERSFFVGNERSKDFSQRVSN